MRAPPAVPIVEAMMALVLTDAWLRQRGQCGEVTQAVSMEELS